MRDIILYIAASLDGKIAGKDHSLDWLPPINEDGEDFGYEEMLNGIDTILMGYKTYAITKELGEWGYGDKTAYIFTRHKDRQLIPGVQAVNDDPVAFVKRLKEQDGKDIWLIGGGEIIRLLHDAALIDKYMIATIPVILGEGIELFPAITRGQKLKVIHHKAYEELIMTHYNRI